MKNSPKDKTILETLRQKAEAYLKNRHASTSTVLTEADALRLVHELEVHQVELEMQSEELRISQIAAQEAIDLYDFDPTAYFTLSSEGIIKGLNLCAANYLHANRKSLQGEKFELFVSDKTKPIFASFLRNVFLNRANESCEIVLSLPGRDASFVFLSGVMDKNNEFCLISAVNTTERRQKEDLVRQERELFQDILNNQPAGIYRIRVFRPEKWWKNAWNNSTNPPYEMEMASNRFCEILGITRQEFETNPAVISDLIHPEDLPEFVRKNEEANSKVIPFRWEGRLVIHQKVSWVHLESFPRPMEEGEIVWTGILYDVSEQKKLEADLIESEKRYRELVDNSPDAIGIYVKGKVVFVNKACLKLMAAKNESELMGKEVIELVHPDYRSLARERMLKIASDQNVLPLTEEKFIRLDGTTVDVEVKAMPIVYQQKNAIQLIVRDISERKKAEDELQASREEFKDLFDNAPVGYHEIDSEGRIVHMNQTELDMFGYQADEIIGKYIWEIAHNKSETYREVKDKLKGKNIPSSSFEALLLGPNGYIHTILIQDKIIRTPNGTITGIRSTIQDITERKNAELNLQFSEEKFRNVFENSVIGKSMTTVDGMLTANKAFCLITGYSREELAHLHWTEFTHTDDIEFNKHLLETILSGEKTSAHWEKRYIHKMGHIVWVDISTFLLRDNEGNPIHFITEIYDITERIKWEEELKNSEKKHRQIIETAMDGFWITDIDGRIMEVNNTYCQMSGYSMDELLKMNISDLVVQEETDQLKIKIHSILHTGQDRFESRHRKKDGSLMDVEICVQYQSSTTKLLITFIRDITERKFVENALMESEFKFRKLFDNTPLPILYVNKYGTITHRNKMFVDLLGYTEKEMPTLDEWWQKAYPEREYRDSVFKNWEEAISNTPKKNGEILNGIYHVTCKDGVVRELLIQVNQYSETYLTTFIDLTDQKEAEKRLNNSREILRKLLFTSVELIDSDVENLNYQKMTDMILEISGAKYASFNLMDENNSGEFSTVAFSGLSDIQTKASSILGFKLVNKRWKEDTNRTAKISQHIITRFETLHELTGDVVISSRIISFIENTFHLGEINVVKISKNNRIIGDFTLLYTNENSLQNQELVELFASQLGLFIERNIAIKSLSSSEEKYRYLFANNPQPMWIFNLETLEFLEINQATIDLYGYTREEFMTMTIKDIRPAEEVSKILKSVQVTTDDVNSVGEWKHIKKNGDIIIVDVTVVPVVSKGRKARHVMVQDITERKLAEVALKESEDKYRTMIENSNDMIWTLDKDAKFTFLNDKALTSMGLLKKDWIGKSFLPLAVEGEMAMLMNIFVRTMNGESCTYELLFKVADDNIRAIQTNTSPIMISGEVVGVVSFGRDITEQNLAEKALKESEDLYRNLVQKMPDGVYKSTPEGKFVDVNPAMVHLLGYENKEELMDIDIKTQLYFDSTDREGIVLNETFEEKGVFQFKKKDGSAIWVEDHGWFRTDELGNIIFHEGVIRDITESKKALQMLQQSEEKFRSIAEQTSDLISITDRNGIIEYASPASTLIFQCEPYEMCGQSFTSFLDEESIATAEAAFVKDMETGMSANNLELLMKRKDGSLFYGELNGSRFNYGKKTGTLVMIRDISERKKAQEELELRMTDIIRFNKLTIDREMNMIHLKTEINELLHLSGKDDKYKIVG